MDYIIHLEPWFRAILYNGFGILRDDFYNYSPAYMYLLAFSTLLPVKPVIAIKIICLPFIPIGGYYMTRLAKLFNKPPFIGWLAYSLFLFTPTVIINSSYWGQADVFYGVPLLATIYYLLKKKPLPAMIALGISFSFKAQAAFLGPFILLLLLRKNFSWKYILIPPGIFFLSCLPVVFVGRSFLDVLMTYPTQTITYRHLSYEAASMWAYFRWLDTINFDFGVISGIFLCLIAVIIYNYYGYKKIDINNNEQLFIAALLSLFFMPFILPKMHDRYFYVAEITSIGFLFLDWRYLWTYILMQVSAANVYWADLRRKGELFPLELSATLNLIVLFFLVFLFMRPNRNINNKS